MSTDRKLLLRHIPIEDEAELYYISDSGDDAVYLLTLTDAQDADDLLRLLDSHLSQCIFCLAPCWSETAGYCAAKDGPYCTSCGHDCRSQACDAERRAM